VDRGWYFAGPSDALDRRKPRELPDLRRAVYEIRNGELGRLHRDGGIVADSRDYLMNVDAVGTDFRLYPIRTAARASRCRPKKLAMAADDAEPRPGPGG